MTGTAGPGADEERAAPDLAALLAGHPYFAPAVHRLADLVGRGRVLELAAGESLFMQGERAEGLYLVVAGRLQAVRYSADGQEYMLAEFGPGDTLAEVPAWDGGRCPSTAVARERSRVFLLPRRAFRAWVLGESGVAEAVIDRLTAKLRQTTRQAEDLALRPVAARLARVLLQQRDAGGEVRLTHQELAALAGSVRQVVGRVLQQLEEDGLVRLGRGRIEITGAAGLRAWLDADADA